MPYVAHLMLVMLRLTPFVAHLMLVMVLNRPEQYSFQDLLFHLLFMPKYAEKFASRMDTSLRVEVEPQGSLLKVEPHSANPKRKKQRPSTIGARSLKRTHDPLGH